MSCTSKYQPSVCCFFFLLPAVVFANNLTLSNVRVEPRDTSTAYICFDISWENSWRHGVDHDQLYFHDAAWVFFKVAASNNSEWLHVKLVGSGVNPDGYDIGSGTGIEMEVPADGVGMFVRRSQDGSGTTAVADIKAVWNFKANNLTKSSHVKIQAFGLEMVYVAEGSFKVGDGLATAGRLFEGGEGNAPVNPKPYAITSSGPIECGDEVGKLWGEVQSGGTGMGGTGTIPAAFPNGYNAFYCMKYLLTQGQYTDFLNTLSRDQQAVNCAAVTLNYYMTGVEGGSEEPVSRNTISVHSDPAPLDQPRVYTNEAPERACNYLAWGDLASFADWAGLRPMTELEFVKACRGPLEPVPDEYAWGSSTISYLTGFSGVDGSGEEFYTTGNIHYSGNGGPKGPIRVGIFAKPLTTREQSGASFWGILDLSGNLYERFITIGNATGRSFTGQHGDGTLTESGNNNVADWPSANGNGTGRFGGQWETVSSEARISTRYSGASVTGRLATNGGRLARSYTP